jgi:hypothetical protein
MRPPPLPSWPAGAGCVLHHRAQLLIGAVTWVGITFFRREEMRHTFALGYSWCAASLALHWVDAFTHHGDSVVFGLMAIASVKGGSANVFGVGMPAQLTPFLSLLLTQLIMPNASLTARASHACMDARTRARPACGRHRG